MGHRVAGPGVPRVVLDGAAARLLRPRVVAVLLEPEGVHPEDVAEPRHGRIPGVEDLGHVVPQAGLAPEVEVTQVGELERQEIPRVVGGDARVALGRALVVPVEPGARRGQVPPLALVRRRAERLACLDRLAQRRHQGPLRGGGEEPRLERVPHGEAGIPRQREVDHLERVPGVAGGHVDRALVGIARGAVVGGQEDAAAVLEHRRLPGDVRCVALGWP